MIAEGDTQWMTAGSGILHDELPTERAYRLGGPAHAVQLWVNLPASLKFTAPRYQAITRDDLVLLTSHDGGALLRLIAGDVASHRGPGATHTPITYLHATITPGAQLSLPWSADFSAMAYVLTGQGLAGPQLRPVSDHQLVQFGRGDNLVLQAANRMTGDWDALDVLLLGGLPSPGPRTPPRHPKYATSPSTAGTTPCPGPGSGVPPRSRRPGTGHQARSDPTRRPHIAHGHQASAPRSEKSRPI